MQLQKRYTLQYEHIKKNAKFELESGVQGLHKKNNSNNKVKSEADINAKPGSNKKKKKYAILDPSKESSIISSKRLVRDGIDITDIEKLPINPTDFTEDLKNKIIIAKLELNLLIGKEKFEKKIFVYVSEELNEDFYLGNDFLSTYSIMKKEKDNAIKYNLRQEIEIGDISGEAEETPNRKQKKYKVQFKYINEESETDVDDEKTKYVILDPSKRYSLISSKRLEKDGIKITPGTESELNLLIGKEKFEKKILVYVSENSNEEFYLGNDFLSSYSIEKEVNDNIVKYNLRQEVEIEWDISVEEETSNCEIQSPSNNKDHEQKKYKVQYKYINEDDFEGDDEKKKYVILDPLKKYSIISLKRLKDEIKIIPTAELELNLLMGKERLEKKILIYVSEESNEEFYLGNDFLSSYSIEKEVNDYIVKYNLRQEIEIERDISGEDSNCEQKKYKVQYKYINEEAIEDDDGRKKYVILDPSKEYSMISSDRLEKDGIDITDIKELPTKPADLTEDMKINFVVAKLELSLLIGKEKFEKKILVYLSMESNEDFYLGNDFLSSYSIKKDEKDNTVKYNLRQEVEIEDETSSTSTSSSSVTKSSSLSPSLESPSGDVGKGDDSGTTNEISNEGDFLESSNKGSILENIYKGSVLENIYKGSVLENIIQRLIPLEWKLFITENINEVTNLFIKYRSTSSSFATGSSSLSPSSSSGDVGKGDDSGTTSESSNKGDVTENKRSVLENIIQRLIPLELFITENINEVTTLFIKYRSTLLYFIISLIIAIFAINIFNYQFISSDSVNGSSEFNFDEFVKYAEEFGYETNSIELPSNEVIKRNIIDCNSIANRIDQSAAFKDTGPQLVINLNEFSEKLEIAKSSYTQMYSDGVWFFYNFEQTIKNILDYISAKSLISSIQRKMSDDKEKIYLLLSVEDSIEALRAFDSSVDKAYKATRLAESFRNGTHHQVIKAKREVQQFIHNNNHPSFWRRFWNFIYSLFDRTRENELVVDTKIATNTENLLENIDENLEGIAGILLHFKENLDKHISVLLKLSASIESLEQIRWNEYEIKKAESLLSTIKESHKKFKLKVD